MIPIPFIPFPKLARLARECCITEKIDGTNAQVHITEAGDVFAGSRTRWITPQADNYGFARWVEGNKAELLKLGAGSHFGEWWGSGIQRGYGLKNGDKRFSLFNAGRWTTTAKGMADGLTLAPACCEVVPVLHKGEFNTTDIDGWIAYLRHFGSIAAPGFMRPEGIVVYHTAAAIYFKRTVENDEKPKGAVGA